jgi:hypothetical protein
VLNAVKGSPCHPTDVERAALIPRDEALSHIRRIKLISFYEASGDTQCHLGIIGNRACWLAMGPIPEHLGHAPVFTLNLLRRCELYRTTERITAGKSQQDSL